MLISLCIIAYNEEKTLPSLFTDILKQDYPKKKIELILIDSDSSDNTKQLMEDFKRHNDGYYNIQILDNEKRKLACGWNVALRNYRGDAIIKVDAHANIPKDFISKNVACLEGGEFICGGKRPNIIDNPTLFKNTLLLAESSMFGSSIASYRRQNQKSYVKSLFHGAYRREVFNHIGFFNENLGRTEDNEIHYRIRKAGYKICLDPSIISFQHTRSSLSKMLKQKYANGYWIGLTLGVCPGCISIFHLVPFAFIMGIIITSILTVFGMPFLAILMWSCYILLAISMATVSILQNKFNIYNLLLPFLFFLLHISYGIGTLVGLIKLPFMRKELLGENL